jgi:hypothetical protein
MEDALKQLAVKYNGSDATEADDFARRKRDSIWSKLVRRLDQESNRGLEPTFKILNAASFELSWFPAINALDSQSVKLKKARLAFKGEILDEIDTLNSREYEALGCLVCELSGATKWHLTPPGNDKGIDFLAVVPAFGKAHVFPSIKNEIRIVGQSKKWDTAVRRDKLEYLADTTVDGFRKKSQTIISKLPNLPAWFLTSDAPLVGCMIGHSGLQSGAWEACRDRGVIGADSRDVAEILCMSRSFPVSRNFDDVRKWLRTNLQRILNT